MHRRRKVAAIKLNLQALRTVWPMLSSKLSTVKSPASDVQQPHIAMAANSRHDARAWGVRNVADTLDATRRLTP